MLEARDVTFGYGKGEPVLRGLSLAVAPGERVALVAPSGAGKTTLCRLLAGYEQPQAGKVLADGAPLPRRGRCPVQLVGQHPELALDPRMTLAASLAEALRGQDGGQRGRRKGGEPIPSSLDGQEKLLGRFGIQRRWLGRYPRELSGGELQRLCLVRALLARPAYLVADEMTASLDALSQAQVWHELIAELERSAMGLVFTTHSPALAQHLATRVVGLRDLG